jgi:hypothetical protein
MLLRTPNDKHHYELTLFISPMFEFFKSLIRKRVPNSISYSFISAAVRVTELTPLISSATLSGAENYF